MQTSAGPSKGYTLDEGQSGQQEDNAGSKPLLIVFSTVATVVTAAGLSNSQESDDNSSNSAEDNDASLESSD